MIRFVASASLIAVSACALPGTVDTRSFDSRFDRSASVPEFAEATAHNIAVQTGQSDYRVDLSRRFASEVPTTVTFAFGSAQLSPQARSVLAQQARWIRQFPELRFRVYGHTDAVGSDAANLRLGQRRANAVVAFFQSQGVGRERLEAVVSRGERDLLVPSAGREPRNRRTVTDVVGFVQTAPMVLDGQYAAIVHRQYIASAAN